MAVVADILMEKGGYVYAVDPLTTVVDATQLMNRHRIGALVVQEGGHVVGIFTERDVLTRVVAERRDPERTFVEQVMTSDVAVCYTDTPVEDVAAVMKAQRIRHLPVLDQQDVMIGLISLGDINAYRVRHVEAEVQYLHEYIQGRA